MMKCVALALLLAYLAIGVDCRAYFKISARDLLLTGDVPDAFAKVIESSRVHAQTGVIWNNVNPNWSQVIEVSCGTYIEVQVVDADQSGNPSSVIGSVLVHLEDLHYLKHGERTQDYQLKRDGINRGRIFLTRTCRG